jgi:L-asparaginase / beta-aspartyl-peptidase
MNQAQGWALIVNGGAKEIEPGEEEANRAGCREAAEAGRKLLEKGASAVEAVEAAVRVLERLPVFNAAYGAVLNQSEEVELCAGMMSGRDLAVGAVAAAQGLLHPISVARMLLDEDPILLGGEGALAFARERGAEICDPDDLITPDQREGSKEAKDTVGAVALDSGGNIAAATSTGGLSHAMVGRIGDSPLPGCGYYADNHVGGVAYSGDGESIARLTLAARLMGDLRNGSPLEGAIAQGLAQLPHVGGAKADGGAIAIAKDGRIGWWHNSPHFAVGIATSRDPEPRAYIRKDEE